MSYQWITPSVGDILTRVSAAELDAFKAVALGAGQDADENIAAQITIVVDCMRGYIRRCSQHVMGPGGTIPPEAMHFFLDLIVPVIQMRPAGALIDSSGVRMDARSDAYKWLVQVAKCDVLFEDSVRAPQPDSGPVGSPSICAPRRTRTNRQEDGI